MTEMPKGAVAIVGMACRFPGADTPEQFWRNIVGKVESVQFFSEQQLLAAGVSREQLARPNYVRAAAVLDDIAGFDAALFGISAREARLLDPQHRVFLECCWAALEDAAIDPNRSEARIGVFAGSNLSGYAMQQLDALMGGESAQYMEALVANDKDYLSTRVAYRLNLRGPSVTVGTACSTSLTAVALGCQTLQAQGCDVVLAGGVCITVPRLRGYEYGSEGDALSTDGHCRAFDAAASGTAPGQGAGVVVLKRLEDALADRDSIYAVIRGYALNNDGSDKVGYWAPSVAGQTEAVLEALEFSGVDARDVSYVEAHGTGTPLGDPMEIAALTSAFRAHTNERGYCAIGSVKTNIGHTSQAAGVASLIKTALAVHHAQLPPSLNFKHENPKLQLSSTPFFVNTTPRPWQGRRLAGVNSLGLGGTNVHVLVEQAPLQLQAADAQRAVLLPVSANSERALAECAEQLAAHIVSNEHLSLQSIAATLQRGRRQLPVRGCIVARSLSQASTALAKGELTRRARRTAERAPEVVFVFPGAANLDLPAVHQLCAAFPSLRERLSEGALHARVLGVELGSLLPPSASEHTADATDLPRALASLLVVEVALAELLIELGVVPAAVLGHSSGEYAAACVSGALELAEALRLQIGRARLLSAMPIQRRGAMLSVNLPADQVGARLDDTLEISAHNAQDVTLVAGDADQLASLARQLGREGLVCQPSSVLGAAHSRFVDPILEQLSCLAETAVTSAPKLAWISTATGQRMPAVAPSAEHWVRHTRQPVRFAQAIAAAAGDDDRIFLELGPGGNLSSLILRILRTRGMSNMSSAAYSSMPGPNSEADSHLLQLLGRLWTAGVPVDLITLGRTRDVTPARLPTYPFERVRYWIGSDEDKRPQRSAAMESEPAEGPHLYRPIWVRTPRAPAPSAQAQLPQVLLSDGCPLCAVLRALAREQGRELLELAKSADDTDELLAEIALRCPDGAVLLHCRAGRKPGPELLDEPAVLAKAIAKSGYTAQLQWLLLTAAAQPVFGDESITAAMSGMAAAVRVLPRELPNLQARWIDLERTDAVAAAQVLAELNVPPDFHHVAYRRGQRWQSEYRRVEAVSGASPLRAGGRYLITGGLGRMGLSLAQYLGELPSVQLALTYTRELPDEADWAQHASAQADVGSTAQILHDLLTLRARGVALKLARVDASDEQGMRALARDCARAWGGIDGVFHFAATLEDKAFGLLSDDSSVSLGANAGPKLRGAQVLAQLARDHQLGFCCLASSIAAELGGLGNYGYSSTNRALDAYARQWNLRPEGGHARWLSLNFDYYRPQSAEDGRQDPREQRSGAIQRLRTDGALRGRDLLRVLECALPMHDEPQLIACGLPIEQHVARYLGKARSQGSRAARPDLSSEWVAPRNELERALAELWQELLCVEAIGVRDDFFELGGDSLLVQRFASAFRERFARPLPIKTLLGNPTIEQLAQQLDQADQDARPIALRALESARHTLFCVPYAGGSALGFRKLTAALPDDWAVWVLPAAREVADADALLDAVAEQLRSWPSPLSIYGHCGGSFAAVELARRLELLGRRASVVFAAAALPPEHGTTLSAQAQSGIDPGLDVTALLQSIGGLPEHADAADAHSALAAMHEDGERLSALFERFRVEAAQSRLRTPLVCLFGGSDPLTSDWQRRSDHWHTYFEQVSRHALEGVGHYFVHSAPTDLARVLEQHTDGND